MNYSPPQKNSTVVRPTKSIWRERGLLSNDLDNMSESAAEKHVKKSNIWKKPDYQALIDGGTSVDIAFFMKIVRDSLLASPVYSFRDDTAEKRIARQKQYIDTVRAVQAVMERVRTKEDALAAFDRCVVTPGYYEYLHVGPSSSYASPTAKAKANSAVSDKLATTLFFRSENHYEIKIVQKAEKLRFGVPKPSVMDNMAATKGVVFQTAVKYPAEFKEADRKHEMELKEALQMDEKTGIKIPEYTPYLNKEGVDLNMSGFSITRIINGEAVNIELTVDERSGAYLSAENDSLYQDIELALSEMDDDELNGHTVDEIIENSDLMGMIFETYTHNRDKYGTEWYEAATTAITKEIKYAEENGIIPVVMQEADTTAIEKPVDTEKKPSLREQLARAQKAAAINDKIAIDKPANVTGHKKPEVSR